jgi:hypothetical protein
MLFLVANSGFQGCVGGRFLVMKESVVIVPNLPSSSSITDPNGVCELMDCLAIVFVDEFLNFFNIFCHFAGAWSP